MPTNWYYAVDQQRTGPLSEEQFAALAKEGRLLPDTLVWNETMSGWQRLAEVRPDLLTSAGAGTDMEFCAVSGKAYPRSQMIQYQGKWISSEHRDTFFQRLREGVTAPGDMVYAGFGRRFVAKILDIILIQIVVMIKSVFLVMMFFGHTNIFAPQSNPLENMPMFMLFQFVNFVTNLMIGIAYTWFFLAKYQATPGKMALGMKVVRADGSKLAAGRIIGRYFAELLSFIPLCIGYFMVAFDEPEHRSLHDRVCDTRVIKTQ